MIKPNYPLHNALWGLLFFGWFFAIMTLSSMTVDDPIELTPNQPPDQYGCTSCHQLGEDAHDPI